MPQCLSKAIAGLVFAWAAAAPAFSQVSVPAGGAAALSPGSALGLGCTDLNVTGNVAVGAGQITQGATVNIGASGVLNGGQGLINTSTGWNNAGTFIPGSGTVIISDTCATSLFQFGGSTVFNNLSLISTAGRSFVIPAGSHITVNGTLTLQGAPGAPIQLVSSTPGSTAYVTLGWGAQLVSSNASVASDVQIGQSQPSVIPTLSETGLFLLALLLMLAAAKTQQIQRRPAKRGSQSKQQLKGEA